MPKYCASELARADFAGRLSINDSRKPRPGAMALAVCIALGLSACGGGGGGGNVKANPPPTTPTTPTPPPPPPPPPPPDTSPMVVSTDLAVASDQTITRPIVLESGADLDNQGAIGGTTVDIGVEAKAPSIVTNHGGGTILGSKTAVRLDQGGEIHNGAGSRIEATGTSSDCGALGPCAIVAGSNDQLQSWEIDFTLVNEGTIVGNIKMDPAAYSWVHLMAGSVIQGSLDFGSGTYPALELDGLAGTVQRYSAAVTGNTIFSSTLTKSGEGTWVIDTDLSPFQVTVNGGTLQIGDGGTAGWVGGDLRFTIFDGRLVFDRSDDIVVGGVILGGHDASKSSTLVQAGTGTLTLTNDNTLIRPDFIVIEDGTLRIHDTGNMPAEAGNMYLGAEITDNASLVFDSNMAIYQTGVISGTGFVIQNGSSALIFNAANTYSGGTTINDGTLQSSEILPGHVFVNSPGALLPSPGVAGDLYDAGRVVVAGSDTTVGGDYQQTAAGTLAVSLGSKLAVTGLAWLGGTLEITGANDGYVANTHTEVLTAGGGINGTFFAQLVKDPGVVFTSTTINYDANSVWLDTTGLNITTAAAGSGIGYTPASMGSAVRVQGAFEQLNDRISTDSLAGVSTGFLQSAGLFQQAASIEAAQASLRSLSGQLHAASAAMTFRAIDAGNQALSDHLDGLRDGNAAYGMWTQQLGSGGGMARNGFDGVGFQMDGWLVGNDFRLGRSGVVGFAFGQGQGVQQLQAGADRDASRRTEGMVYAGLTSDRWYAQGRLGFGQFRQDVNRQLLLGNAAEGVWTRYGGRYQVGYGESGLRFGVGEVRIAPFVSMEYARSDRDAFAEEGAGGFGLRSDAQSTSRWQASAGIRAARQWSFGKGRSLDVGAHAQWFRTLGTTGEAMDASFVGLPQWSPLLGIGLSRYGSLAGVGIDASLSPKTTFKLSYDYERGQYDNAHGMTAGVNIAF